MTSPIDGFYFPPPPVNDERILAVVVEKKGEADRTSMRQSEIYAYSPKINIRDGYMVMPRDTWRLFEPGDWFVCNRSFSTNFRGEMLMERDLYKLNKIDPGCHSQFGIPQTSIAFGAVRIVVPFVLGPDFIRRRSNRTFHKLYLLDIGIGFFRCREFRNLMSGTVYTGRFEFRGKDNGAVNFEATNVLERSAMWELVEVVQNGPNGVPIGAHARMNKALEKLREQCVEYARKINNKEEVLQPFRLEPVYRLTPPTPAHTPAAAPTPAPTPAHTPAAATAPATAPLPVFSRNTVSDVETLRSRTIVRQVVYDRHVGRSVMKWVDVETMESSSDQDILNFKFDTRYGVGRSSEVARRVFPSPREHAPRQQPPIVVQNFDPLASSTPRTSPVARRRTVFPAGSETTDTLEQLRLDNNANPVKI